MRPGYLNALPCALALLTAACGHQATPTTHLQSLADVSIEAMRAREYSSLIRPLQKLSNGDRSYVAAYDSDGNRVYTRIDIPRAAPPDGGYPAVIFVHGWYGIEAAPAYDFEFEPGSLYTRTINAYLDAGFLVLSPALRGHGTVNEIPAEGIEFLQAWDNGSYISPMFYAIDVLNLLEGITSLEDIDWNSWGIDHQVLLDRERINISGHSQGGDAVLAALAVSGENSSIRNTLATGSIWSGCFGPRFEQVEIYGPMASTLEAFMSGDGQWTGTATATNGSVNPNFVFGFPADWIGTVDTSSADWTWQAESWSSASVADALDTKFSEMYDAVNRQVADIQGAEYTITTEPNGKATVHHDERITESMRHIGGYYYEQYLSEPIHLHHSDQDYYSIPRWNAELALRINQAGGHATDYNYPQNTHSLLRSEHDWFSEGEVIEGFGYMLERDLALFGSGRQHQEAIDLSSITEVSRYAAALSNEFQLEFERPPLEGIARRVVSFTADDLKQYALVLEPGHQPPDDGWPILLMNHGHHPIPPDYGRVADGSTDRPGDYYRGLPLAFAKQGFLVVVPDFRGHNDSENGGYQQDEFESWWYTRDAVAAFRALPSLPRTDSSNVFMWGHSMGGNVTLRALLALGSEVRGASIWSSSSGRGASGSVMDLPALETPLNIHHSSGDPVTPASWSEAAFKILQHSGKTVNFYSYASDDHLFHEADLQRAIDRDVIFFRNLSNN